MPDLQGDNVQRWQGLGMECRSVREYQSFGLKTDFLEEVRKRERVKSEGQGSRPSGNPCGWEARAGQSSEGYR